MADFCINCVVRGDLLDKGVRLVIVKVLVVNEIGGNDKVGCRLLFPETGQGSGIFRHQRDILAAEIPVAEFCAHVGVVAL